MAIEIFRFDDAVYETWLHAHRRDGYVVSARQRITPAYLKLYTAWCDHINALCPSRVFVRAARPLNCLLRRFRADGRSRSRTYRARPR